MNISTSKSTKRPVKQQVYSFIRDKIIIGDMEGGEFIEEEAVSAMLGVSRTPVREAFLKLEAERFIDLIPRKGARVRQITGQEVANIYETRRLIETYAARKICEESIEIPDDMIESHERMSSLYSHDFDIYKHIINDDRFHLSMVEAIDNPVLVDIYKSIQDRKMRVAFTAVSLKPERIGIIISQHQNIVDALFQRDMAAVESVLTEHLRPIDEVINSLPQ
ncbi:GntR family transcriptional regulator [Aidingimonas lacisalsi]|uniref:GntR family transcriptional regulator n=1 Tax=Aidingimonas lacisalsi TaxID=2604086 RepID=UPI0011D1B787|nr:GntR family transcriptional regulator [Aidingimonas lacisalsi]